MSILSKLKFLWPGGRRAMEEDMQEELDSLAALAKAEGDRASLGSLARAAEEGRSVWTWESFEQICGDLRYAARTMRRQPGFTATAVLSLALGIGANAAIFSLMNAILLKRLPVSDPDRLVVLTSYSKDGKIGDFGYRDYLALRDGSSASSGLLAASRLAPVVAGIAGETETVQRKIVSGNYFDLLGVRAIAGRTFQPGEEEQRSAAVISYGWWKRSFGGATIAGQQVELDGMAFPVVGVAPPEFLSETAGEDTDVWATIPLMPAARRNGAGFTWLNLMGRLKPGVTLQELNTTLRLHAPEIQNRFIERIEAEPGGLGGPGLRNTFRTPLTALMAVVALVLLITCANLAGLLLSRAAGRQKEIATRLAIGASRGRLFRQLMTESVFLALMGGLLALLFAVWGQRFLLNLVAGAGRTITLDLRPDMPMLLFTAAISMMTVLLFGLAPALHALRPGGPTGRRWGLRDALLSFQVALSMLLLVVSGLFIRTLHNLKSQDLGVRTGNVVTAHIDVQRGHTPAWAGVIPELLRRAEAVPGVLSATAAFNGTLMNSSGINGFQIEGRPAAKEALRAGANWVGPKYFETLGIPVVEGRGFLPADHAASQRVAVVNQTMGRRYLGGGPAVGSRLLFNGESYEIVGVARDSKYGDLRENAPPFVYFAALQSNSRIHSLELRTADSVAVAGIRELVRAIDPRLRVVRVATLEERIEQKLAREILLADLAGLFGALTLALVVVGVYGTLAYAVARRTREIGIRIALGARISAVAGTVMRDLLIVSAVGMAVGLIASLAAGRLLGSLLFGLGPADPVTAAAAALILCVATLAAGWLPVQRAYRVDPASTLRLE